jgi:hypothetical protein
MRVLTAFAAATLLSVSMPAASGDVTPAHRDSTWPAITIDPAPDAWTRRVEWGLGRFRDAGLQLPPMVITVHADDAPCDGNSGVFLPNNPWEVHLCAGDDADSRVAKLTTLHELAHAWAESQLSLADRAAFLELRGLDVWYDPRVPPHLRGAEHAAEVISWGLMDEMVPIIRVYDAEPAELSEAFHLLVHQPPLWLSSAASTPASADAATTGSVHAPSTVLTDGDVARPHVLDSQLASPDRGRVR